MIIYLAHAYQKGCVKILSVSAQWANIFEVH